MILGKMTCPGCRREGGFSLGPTIEESGAMGLGECSLYLRCRAHGHCLRLIPRQAGSSQNTLHANFNTDGETGLAVLVSISLGLTFLYAPTGKC